MHAGALIAARSAWADNLHARLLPGAHVILLTADENMAVEGRKLGFELRDTLLLLWPQAASFAFLFRKEADEDTIAEQVATTSAGSLNIEVCRIQGGIKQATAGRRTIRWGVGQGGCTYEKGTGAIFTTEGRWPCNILLIHGPRCQRVGERRIDGHKGYPNGPGGSSSQFSQKGIATTRKSAWAGHADAEGKETITIWDCQPDCPALILDRQSGDGGSASRFYPQFASPWEALNWLRALIGVPGAELLEEL